MAKDLWRRVHRLRQRRRELVREEIAQTVTTVSEIDEELRYLIARDWRVAL